MYKISRNKYLDFEYLFLVKKQMRATEVIIEDGSVGARVGNGDLFVYHQVVMEYFAPYQNTAIFFSPLKTNHHFILLRTRSVHNMTHCDLESTPSGELRH